MVAQAIAEITELIGQAVAQIVPIMTFKNGRRFDCDLARGTTESNWFLQIAEDHVPERASSLTPAQIQGIYGAAGVPPSFRLQPASQALDAGTSASIPALVSGSAPINYQWYRNGASAAGQT